VSIKINLPRKTENGKPRFSNSQFDKWIESPRKYIRRYFFNEEDIDVGYMAFGTKVGTALEEGDFNGFTTKERKTLNKVTRLDQFEKEIYLDFENFCVVCYIDTNNMPPTLLIDYKTGDKSKKEKYSSEKYKQLVIYAAAIKQKYGKLPKCRVELIERLGNAFKGEELSVGDNVWKIPQQITMKRVKEVKQELVEVVTEVSEYYRLYKLLNVKGV
jgi:hypothetical protein